MMTGLESCDTIGERLIQETGRDGRRRINSEVLLGPSTTHGDVTPRQTKRPRIEPAMGDAARNPKRKGGREPEQSRNDVEQQTRWKDEWKEEDA
jgi:hypothetical protein